ncbi:MAG: hypothetical protein ACRBBP_08790 [Bdellovibrionales bacterium]
MKLILSTVLFSAGCVSGHCGRDGKAVKMDKAKQKVLIYKYDGSKQCEEKTGADLDEMAKELSGLKIFSMSKKSDGQMRVQVCGALTGRANVYEVSAKDLPKAEALGFKKWNF